MAVAKDLEAVSVVLGEAKAAMAAAEAKAADLAGADSEEAPAAGSAIPAAWEATSR
jgi:hypothetical protein